MSNKYSQTTMLLFKMMIQLVLITLTSTKMKSEILNMKSKLNSILGDKKFNMIDNKLLKLPTTNSDESFDPSLNDYISAPNESFNSNVVESHSDSGCESIHTEEMFVKCMKFHWN